MTTLTPRQANVMDHALAYPKRYRNHFFAPPGTPNDATWKELVVKGYATLMRRDGAYNVYFVTDIGIDSLVLHHKNKEPRK